MITKEKIDIYNKYKGDSDMFVRCRNKKERDLINSGDFGLIADLLQNIEIADNGLASQSFKDKLAADLIDMVEPECLDLLKNSKI